MPSEFIVTSAEAGVFTITLNRPAKMNALLPEMHMALAEAFDAFAANDALQVCVVKGAGERAFCAGSDLTSFKSEGGSPYPATGYAGIAQRWDLAKPVIAAVNGLCLGGGFELALSCDMIVASQSAVFGLPEPKVGLIAIGGGIHRLVRQTGLKQAMGPLLTGRNISAAEGRAMGFVSEVVSPEGLDAAVTELCNQILACAPLAVQLTKQLAMWGLDQPTLPQALADQVEQPAFHRWMQSEDAREGTKAFAEKRTPQWTGR
jgi:crotonobetainyl-CoA hydratase